MYVLIPVYLNKKKHLLCFAHDSLKYPNATFIVLICGIRMYLSIGVLFWRQGFVLYVV